MNTCINCKFWNRNGDPQTYTDQNTEDWDDVALPHRKCLRIIHGNKNDTIEMKDAPAAVLDGSGYAASLWTLPDFGCTSFDGLR
jgi:hypothetical protein